MEKPFSNIKVIELAGILAGPAAGAFFAELGATVIKYENIRSEGDPTRHWKLPVEKGRAYSAYYASVNIGKERRWLDLKKKEEIEALLREIESADIVLSNFLPEKAARYKLDYANLSRLNPGLIYGEITGFPGSDRPAFDVVLQAESGLMSINGETGSNPLKVPVAFIDQFAAHQLKEGILLAMLEKSRKGKGAHVRVSLYEAALSCLANQASNYLMTGQAPVAMGSLHPNIAPYGEQFTCSDGKRIVLAVGSDDQFDKLCSSIGFDEEKKPAFARNVDRVINREELSGILQEFFMHKPAGYWINLLNNEGVPAGLIKSISEVFSEPAARTLVRSENVEGEFLQAVKTNVFRIL